jgi:aspartate ammonia-lyase
MDAVPITLGSEFGAYAQAVAPGPVAALQGGGAAPAGQYRRHRRRRADNAERQYRFEVIEQLRELTDIGLAAAEYPMDITQKQ